MGGGLDGQEALWLGIVVFAALGIGRLSWWFHSTRMRRLAQTLGLQLDGVSRLVGERRGLRVELHFEGAFSATHRWPNSFTSVSCGGVRSVAVTAQSSSTCPRSTTRTTPSSTIAPW